MLTRFYLCLALAVCLTGCTPQASTLAASTSPPVKLSAGVALPQLGPEGTLMMFSVDYRFMDGAPKPDSTYVWVIEPTKGDPIQLDVKRSQARSLTHLETGEPPPEQRDVKVKWSDNLQAIVPRADLPAGYRGMSLPSGAALGEEAFSSQAMLNHVLEEELLHLQDKARGLGAEFGPGSAKALEEAAHARRRFPLPRE